MLTEKLRFMYFVLPRLFRTAPFLSLFDGPNDIGEINYFLTRMVLQKSNSLLTYCSMCKMIQGVHVGVHVDNSLYRKEHIWYLWYLPKVSRAIGFLKHLKNILPFSSLKPIFDTFVLYGVVVAQMILISSKTLRNRAARIVATAAFVPQVNHSHRVLVRKLSVNLLTKILD